MRDISVSSDREYRNPIDQTTYVAEGGWRLYEPNTPRPVKPGQKVKTGSVRLLMSEDKIAAQTTVLELATFIKEAEQLAEDTFSKSDRQFIVLVQFDCAPSEHEVRLAYQGDATQELLREYYDLLKRAKRLPVRNDKVSFQLELLVNQ